MRIYLIDGHNLLHRIFSTKSKIYDQHQTVKSILISMLTSFLKDKTNTRIILYLDNRSQNQNLRHNINGIQIKYARPGELADDLIKKDALGFNPSSELITVVSGDHGITENLRHAVDLIISASDFSNLLNKKKLKSDESSLDRQLTDREVDQWLDIFNADSEQE